jgi:hypothetical protein
LNGAAATAPEAERKSREAGRRRGVALARMYYEGSQFDARNLDRAKALKCDVWDLPEHEKLHAYSTQIQEAIDFIAAQMSDSFEFGVDDKPTQELLLKALKRSPDLQGGYGENDLSLTNVVRDALVAQDTPVHVRWDAVQETAWPEFWDSEQVEFVYDDRDKYRVEKVITDQSVWTFDIAGAPLKKREFTEWSMNGFECVKSVYFEGEEELATVEPLGIPFIPWISLRATRKQTRSMRGESMITQQAMEHANRYNAVEQVAYLISRYNSHGNLAVIGDGATLKAQMDERINKDVADILTFPGGTAIQVLTLPTDAQMIIHQRTVLIDSLFGSFGLARVDQETLTGLGQVTGYALEILNRKSDGTFAQIRNQYIGDFKKMLNLLLDMTAYKQGEQVFFDGLLGAQDPTAEADLAAVGEAVLTRMDEIDPLTVFPAAKRVFKVHLGSGYVVDRVMLRDDYAAGLISRGEFLRQTGYTDKEIKVIEEEIDKEKPPAVETGLGADAIAAAAAAKAAGEKATGKLAPKSELPKPAAQTAAK